MHWDLFPSQRFVPRECTDPRVIDNGRFSLCNFPFIFRTRNVPVARFIPQIAEPAPIARIVPLHTESCTTESQWVNPLDRVRPVLIDVDAASQPDRVLADEPSDVGIIIPMPVIVQPASASKYCPTKHSGLLIPVRRTVLLITLRDRLLIRVSLAGQ